MRDFGAFMFQFEFLIFYFSHGNLNLKIETKGCYGGDEILYMPFCIEDDLCKSRRLGHLLVH
jgi:hypothetical protein